ncbi:MAG: catalase family peroxidase [Methylocella sp.]
MFGGRAPVMADDADLSTQIVDAMNKTWGVHPGFRANHAKGVVLEGSFTASPAAAALSKAVIFNGAKIPVTVRFSGDTGIPTLPDGEPQAHGLSIKYHLPDGGESDMVTNAFRFFPVANGADFRDMLTAIYESPDGSPEPTKLEQFRATHPRMSAAMATLGRPDSFADEQYNGINAFVFVNKAGEKQAVRYRITPEKVVHLDAADAAKKSPDFLFEELPARLSKGPITFHVRALLAQPGDQTKDPTLPWPDDRKVVDLGVLSIDKIVPDSLAAQKRLLFLPGSLLDGIEQSDDPNIEVRDGAYAVSFSRRNP